MDIQNHALRSDGPRRRDPPEEPSGLEELAARLDGLRLRAASEEWSGWTDGDAATVAEAAREIRTIPQALAKGMKEAFATGREYGHREERLDELNREISVLSSLLAHEAWGGRGPGQA